MTESVESKYKKIDTRIFYGSIGIAASLALAVLFYWGLRLDSNIESLISNNYDIPFYFWPYAVLTIGTVALFGVNASLFTYRLKRFGMPKFKKQAGTGFGSLVGVAASACPICGSTLLSFAGIAGGLAAFPLGGLELKALSFGLMALPVWLTHKEIKRMECGGDTCPAPHDASFNEGKDRRLLVFSFVSILVLGLIGWNMFRSDPVMARFASAPNFASGGNYKLYETVVAKVLPEKGFQSKIVLGDSVVKLVKNGVIDKDKFEAIYHGRGGLSDEFKNALIEPLNKSILLTTNNASFYVNFLWPLGLSNYMSTNKESPINGKSLFNFASTGGWDLGREENGGAYFNKFKIVELTPEQEALATKIAQNSFRPCCNNSTFFQDCNHGSALLGLLQLGAAQGLTEDELYREALAFNSFWFPHNYIQTALYFKAVKNINWEKVDPKEIMGFDYSAIGPWSKNVQAELAKIPNLIPQNKGGASCGT